MNSNPKNELEEFLAGLPAIVRKIINFDYDFSHSSAEDREACGTFDWGSLSDLRRHYERLLVQHPAEWRQYRKAFAKSMRLFVPPARPGRPRKDDLASKARHLQKAGMSYAQIAARLNNEHGKGTTTREAIRKLLSSRKPSSPPEKT